MKILPTEFDGQSIRRVHDEAADIWWFSVVDVVQVLTQQVDDLTARKYWNQLKRRLDKEGSQLVTGCHQLKMPAADGKQRLTDVASAETLLRLVQSVPSPKAEPLAQSDLRNDNVITKTLRWERRHPHDHIAWKSDSSRNAEYPHPDRNALAH